MPEIALTVSDLTTFDRSVGDYVAAADWASGFDHAALVAARRSRADGKDLRMRHTTAGVVPIVAVSGANTSNCRIGFNLVAAILGSMGDTAYRIGFGDLGANFQPTVTAGASGPGICGAVPQAVPALALPNPGYDLTEAVEYGVREFATLVRRSATLHEYPAQTLRLQWRNVGGEDAYAVRAVVESVRGVGPVTFSGFSYSIVPGSFSFETLSAASHNVTLTLESNQA